MYLQKTSCESSGFHSCGCGRLKCVCVVATSQAQTTQLHNFYLVISNLYFFYTLPDNDAFQISSFYSCLNIPIGPKKLKCGETSVLEALPGERSGWIGCMKPATASSYQCTPASVIAYDSPRP